MSISSSSSLELLGNDNELIPEKDEESSSSEKEIKEDSNDKGEKRRLIFTYHVCNY